jgi:hypothetical protein
MRIAAVLLLSVTLCAGVAPSQDDPRVGSDIAGSGNNFLNTCAVLERPSNEWHGTDAMYGVECIAYVSGVRDTLAVLQNTPNGGALNKVLCPPAGITNVQYARIVVKYVRDNPASSHAMTALLAIPALMDAFPCKQK